MPKRFDVEELICTAEAESAIDSVGSSVSDLVNRHAQGDWGTFNDNDGGTPAISFPIRDKAALLMMFDLKLRAADVIRISHSDVDWKTKTVRLAAVSEPRNPELEALLKSVNKSNADASPKDRNLELTTQLQASLAEWVSESQSRSGPLFPELETAYLRNLLKSIQASHAQANEVALLLNRGTVDSLFALEPIPRKQGFFQRLFSSAGRSEPVEVAIQTCLDSRQTLVQAPLDANTVMALQVIASPTLMFGPQRTPFQRTRFSVKRVH